MGHEVKVGSLKVGGRKLKGLKVEGCLVLEKPYTFG